MSINVINSPNNLRNNIVDMLATKNIDMKQRRVINAADAINNGDYVTKSQLDTAQQTAAQDLVIAFKGLVDSFKNVAVTIKHLVTSIISPISDSSGIMFTKEDGTTPVLFIDTENARQITNGPIYSTNGHVGTTILPTVPFVRLEYDPSNTNNIMGDLVAYDPGANNYLPLSLRGSEMTIGYSGGKIGFFTDDRSQAQLKQILISYTPSVVGTFTGIPNTASGNVYATVADLNTLRAAYDNLRVMCDDLRTKLVNSTIIGQ